MASLRSVAKALHLPVGGIDRYLARYLALTPDSAEEIALKMCQDGFKSWKFHLFDFVERFRHTRELGLIACPPTTDLDARLQSLIASTVEPLYDELGLQPPPWCRGIPALDRPWFVSGIDNLKAMALMESPLRFRARNIFVLGNFLNRA